MVALKEQAEEREITYTAIGRLFYSLHDDMKNKALWCKTLSVLASYPIYIVQGDGVCCANLALPS